MEKYQVGVIGGTGMVGQRFITLLEHHPWFELKVIAASPRSAGKSYAEAVGNRWAMDTPIPEQAKDIVVLNAEEDVAEIADQVDFVFSAVDMKKEDIKVWRSATPDTSAPWSPTTPPTAGRLMSLWWCRS